MSEYNKSKLKELYANLAIEDDDESGVIIGGGDTKEERDVYPCGKIHDREEYQFPGHAKSVSIIMETQRRHGSA